MLTFYSGIILGRYLLLFYCVLKYKWIKMSGLKIDYINWLPLCLYCDSERKKKGQKVSQSAEIVITGRCLENGFG